MSLRIERQSVITPAAMSILEEYYEAVHVVQRDEIDKMQQMLEDQASGIWLATEGDEVIGCVVLRSLNSVPGTGECKRLYVKPSARGKGVADLLLDAMECFAEAEGVTAIFLDSYDDLKAAIALYSRRGYEYCARYNDNPQATVFMRKYLRSGV
jgi:GNAT superfamily N-acetyltransferase